LDVIGKDITFNRKIITSQMQSAMEAFRKGDFYAFGLGIAETTLVASGVENDNLFLY